MDRARSTWTDERMDDLAHRVDEGFHRVETRLQGLDGRIDVQGAELSRRIEGLQGQIEGLNRTIYQVGGVTVATILASVLATQF